MDTPAVLPPTPADAFEAAAARKARTGGERGATGWSEAAVTVPSPRASDATAAWGLLGPDVAPSGSISQQSRALTRAPSGEGTRGRAGSHPRKVCSFGGPSVAGGKSGGRRPHRPTPYTNMSSCDRALFICVTIQRPPGKHPGGCLHRHFHHACRVAFILELATVLEGEVSGLHYFRLRASALKRAIERENPDVVGRMGAARMIKRKRESPGMTAVINIWDGGPFGVLFFSGDGCVTLPWALNAPLLVPTPK